MVSAQRSWHVEWVSAGGNSDRRSHYASGCDLDGGRLGLAFSGRSFLRYPELRDRVPGVFLGTDMRSAVVVAHGLGEMIDPERWYNAATPQYRIGPAFGHIEGV